MILHVTALSWDVLIHSIPHLLGGDHDHDHHDHHDHDHSEHKEEEHNHFKMIYIGVLILSGFLIFFIAEKVATRHFHNAGDEQVHDTDAKKEEKKEIIIQDKTAQSELRRRNVGNNSNQTDSNPKDHAGCELNITGKEKISCPGALYSSSFSRLTASGWLNLLADSMHNFTDGIALGMN
jgi:solute carrier family 39 (zinc transporter), member 7